MYVSVPQFVSDSVNLIAVIHSFVHVQVTRVAIPERF